MRRTSQNTLIARLEWTHWNTKHYHNFWKRNLALPLSLSYLFDWLSDVRFCSMKPSHGLGNWSQTWLLKVLVDSLEQAICPFWWSSNYCSHHRLWKLSSTFFDRAQQSHLRKTLQIHLYRFVNHCLRWLVCKLLNLDRAAGSNKYWATQMWHNSLCFLILKVLDKLQLNTGTKPKL